MANRTPQTLWETALGQLELQVTRPNFETWLRPTSALRQEDHALVVGVASDFALEWLKTRMEGIVNRTVSKLLDREMTVLFEVMGAQPLAERLAPAAPRSTRTLVGHLDKKLTFERFVVLKCNRVAYRAAKRAAEDGTYDLLVLSGPAGSGKTHLLHAIGNAVRANGRCVVALTGEAFVERYVSAVRGGQPHTFREAFGDCDFFLLDDLRFLATRVSSQEQFLLALDALRQRGCVFAVTTDGPPEELPGLSERLATRLRSAVVTHLAQPSSAERSEFLQALASIEKHDITPAVLNAVGERQATSIRDLAGRLRQVMTYADLSGQPITASLAHEALRTPQRMNATLSPERIIETVCARFSVSRDQLTGKSRARAVTYPRHLAMYLLRELGSCSLVQIGDMLGGRDHSTVVSGYTRIKQERANLPQTGADLNDLESTLRNPAA